VEEAEGRVAILHRSSALGSRLSALSSLDIANLDSDSISGRVHETMRRRRVKLDEMAVADAVMDRIPRAA
jgi:hypothetical protein